MAHGSTPHSPTVGPRGLPGHPSSETSRHRVVESRPRDPAERYGRSHCIRHDQCDVQKRFIAHTRRASTSDSSQTRPYLRRRGPVGTSRRVIRCPSAGSAQIGRTSRTASRDQFRRRECTQYDNSPVGTSCVRSPPRPVEPPECAPGGPQNGQIVAVRGQAESAEGRDGRTRGARRPLSGRCGRTMSTIDGRMDETVRLSTCVGRAEEFQQPNESFSTSTKWPS